MLLLVGGRRQPEEGEHGEVARSRRSSKPTRHCRSNRPFQVLCMILHGSISSPPFLLPLEMRPQFSRVSSLWCFASIKQLASLVIPSMGVFWILCGQSICTESIVGFCRVLGFCAVVVRHGHWVLDFFSCSLFSACSTSAWSSRSTSFLLVEQMNSFLNTVQILNTILHR